MKARKSLMCIALLCLAMSGMAQEGKPFVTASLGTQGTDDVFRGAGVSVGAGYNLKGLDMGISLDYYSDKWGRETSTYFNRLSDGTNIMSTEDIGGKMNTTCMTLRLVFAYDPLRFIKGNWRHHLRPTIGLGYSQWSYFSTMLNNTTTTQQLEMRETTKEGFELTLGIAYDFNITKNWAVGAFFEEYVTEREQDVMGLRARYSF